MPETEIEFVTKEWLQTELRSAAKDLIILDCRSSNEFTEGHIRSAVNFSIPSIMLRRLAAGKIDLLSTIKSRDLKERIQSNYKISLFVLYNDNNFVCSPTADDGGNNIISGICGGGGGGLLNKNDNGANDSGNGCNISNLTIEQQHHHHYHQQQQQQKTTNLATITNLINSSELTNTTTINVLHRRLKQDGCRVVYLQDGFSSFRDAFPEWCEEDSQSQEVESSRGTVQADQLMGLRSLRISTPHSDSACSSSAESSDCESTTHHNFNEAPVEIVPGLFLGNASHSGDSRALQKYNIKYVLNVTPDLPNVFEGSGGIQYLQIPITDHYSQDLAVHFPKAIQFIDEARSKGAAVLVHCLAGVSRSVTVTLAYLMHTKSLCLNDAFSLVRDRKPDVSPNFHFMEQLHSFERQIRISPNRTLSSTCSTILSSSSSAASTDTTTGKEYEVRCQRSIATKFPCTCVESSSSTSSECKCMQAEFLVNVRPTGVSPDSGIEFDRWTPSDGGLK